MGHALLAPLRDVEGVYGSFVVSPAGQTLADDLPSWMAGVPLEVTSARVARLRETLAPDGPLDWCAIRFADHKLFLRSVGELIFTIVARADTDATALRMAVTLAARRLPDLAAAPPPPPVAPEPPSKPPEQPPRRRAGPPFGSSGVRPKSYRGRRLDEG